MEHAGEGLVAVRMTARRLTHRWWVAGASAALAVILAFAVVLAKFAAGPPAIPCPLPKVPVAGSVIAWASDSRAAIFATPTGQVALVSVPGFAVKAFPKLAEYPVEAVLPPEGRPFAVTLFDPRTAATAGKRPRWPSTHFFVRRLSADGTRWEQCLDNSVGFSLSPDSRHIVAADRYRLRVWRVPDLSLERSVALPSGCAGRHVAIYWTADDAFALMSGPAPRPRWSFRLDTGKIKPAGWPVPERQTAGFQIVPRRGPGDGFRNWLAAETGKTSVEDWVLVATPAGAPAEFVPLGRRDADPSRGIEGLWLFDRTSPVPAIPSPDGRYAFVPAADGTVRLWTRGGTHR